MKAFAQRPPEVASLLNPAIGAWLISTGAAEFERQSGVGLPFFLAFLFMPLALHERTRETLPSNSKSPMGLWVAEHSHITYGFPERMASLVPYSRESIHIALAEGVLQIDEDAGLRRTKSRLRGESKFLAANDEAAAIKRCVRFLARWFAASGSAHAVATCWGVRP